jgi:hypothetical protein
MLFFLSILLISCGVNNKSHSGPLGKEATVAANHITEIQSMNAKMKDLTKSADNLKDAVELQKKLNDYLETAGKELKDFAVQNPNGKPVPFAQKAAKDVYEVTAINFVGYNINSGASDVQAHFQAKVKVYKPGMPNELSADFLDASGNILLKETFYIGVSDKLVLGKEVIMYCNPNEFSKILDLTKINFQ